MEDDDDHGNHFATLYVVCIFLESSQPTAHLYLEYSSTLMLRLGALALTNSIFFNGAFYPLVLPSVRKLTLPRRAFLVMSVLYTFLGEQASAQDKHVRLT